MRSATVRSVMVVKVSSTHHKSPATSANRYAGFMNGSSQVAQCRPSSPGPLAIGLPFDRRTG
ncbi:hypothetical protein D3C85_1564450 [compost metagenome]